MKINGRVVINPDIMAGKPVVKGTRIPVDTIVNLIRQGGTWHEVMENYPNMTKEDIGVALSYVAKHGLRKSSFHPISTRL
ncbi:DUF433 domain-containing protein [Candidatus Woesearchaeota archaeon]|nr:DUF433 domain-containing protein [Candidatus Woesearchaeota archaeon]